MTSRPRSWLIPERGIQQEAPISVNVHGVHIYIDELISKLRESPHDAMFKRLISVI